MAQFQVEKSIVIHATAQSIWEVLTDTSLSYQWVQTWWPEISAVESTWRYGEPVLWKLKTGETGARGTVLESHPYRELKYSFKVHMPERHPKTEYITYHIEQGRDSILLHVKVGNFENNTEDEACYAGAVESWNLALPKIRQLAEADSAPKTEALL